MSLADVRGCNHLIGYIAHDGKTTHSFWRLVKNEEIPDQALNQDYLRKTYADIPFKTGAELLRETTEWRKKQKVGWALLFVWLAVGPAAFAVAEFSSTWLSALVLVFSLWKALVKGLQLSGRLPKSSREMAKEAEELRMQHHHYHCEQNPDGFNRLKIENFERWEKERIRREFESLKGSDVNTLGARQDDSESPN